MWEITVKAIEGIQEVQIPLEPRRTAQWWRAFLESSKPWGRHPTFYKTLWSWDSPVISALRSGEQEYSSSFLATSQIQGHPGLHETLSGREEKEDYILGQPHSWRGERGYEEQMGFFMFS